MRKQTMWWSIWMTLLCIGWLTAAPVLAQIYRWTDEAGRIHFTDNPDTIPPAQRARARVLPSDTPTSGDTSDAVPAPAAPPTPQTRRPGTEAPSTADVVRQIRELEQQLASAQQERQMYVERLSNERPIRTNPAFGRQGRQVVELGRALVERELQIDALQRALQQARATLQTLQTGRQTPASPRRPSETDRHDSDRREAAPWHDRLAAAQERVRLAQEQRQAIVAQLAALTEPEQRARGRQGSEVIRQTKALQQADQELRAAAAALHALRQEATQAGAPPEQRQ